MLIATGDFNARRGSKKDFNADLDHIPLRSCTDTVVNKFGEHFIEFLTYCNLCVLNGRGSHPARDTYTSISSKGLAVVDYVCVPYEQLNYRSGASNTKGCKFLP